LSQAPRYGRRSKRRIGHLIPVRRDSLKGTAGMMDPGVFSTPELRAAFEELKEFVRVNAPAGEIEAHAFRLVGESQEAIDREARELFEVLLQQSTPLKRSTAFGFAFMWRELVCDRIREIEGSGRGHA
jgi:hypothetical protein